jgi:hypothetical protein
VYFPQPLSRSLALEKKQRDSDFKILLDWYPQIHRFKERKFKEIQSEKSHTSDLMYCPKKRNELWRKNDIPPRKFHDPIRILPRFPSVFYYQLDTRMFNEKLRSKIEFEMVVIVVFYSDF